MNEFFSTITSFPVIIFTFLLCLILIYWFMVMLGILDIGEDGSGVEGLEDLGDSGSIAGGISGLLATLGLNGVPVTIVISIMTSLAWLMTSIVTSIFFPHIHSPQIRLVAGIGLMAVVIAITIPITARLIRPLRRFFRSHRGVKKSSFVGHDCVVKTLTVTKTFGQGEINDGEAGIIIDIISNEPNDFTKDDIVVLIEYDTQKDSYYVAKI